MKLDQCPLTAEEKNRMIAQEAYYRYEKRGVTGGDAVEDWLAAEIEIEKHLKDYCQAKPQKRNRAIYPSLSRMTQKVRDLGESVPGIFGRVSTMAQQEMGASGAKLGHRWGDFRVKRTQFLHDTSKNFKNWMSRQRGKDK